MNQIQLDSLPSRLLSKIFNFAMFIMGLTFRKDKRMTVMSFISYAFAIFVLILSASSTILVCRFWMFNLKFNSEQVLMISYTSTLSICIISHGFLIFWQHKGYLCDHLIILMNANGQNGIKNTQSRFNYMITSMYIFITTFLISYIIFIIVFFITDDPFFINFDKVKLAFFDRRLKWLVCFTTIYMISAWFLSNSLIFGVCSLNKMEVRYLNEQLINERLPMTACVVRTYIEKHGRLMTAIRHADEMFKYFLLVQYCGMIPSLTFMLYMFNVSFVENLSSLSNTIFMTMSMLVLTIVPSSLNAEVKVRVILSFLQLNLWKMFRLHELRIYFMIR